MILKGSLGAAVAVAVIAISEGAHVVRRRRRGAPSFPPSPRPELPGILDIDDEGTVDPEPPDLVYSDDEPCAAPPQPWDPAVSLPGMLLEGDATGCVPPADLEPKQRTEVAFAEGDEAPRWPLSKTKDPKLRVSYQDVRGLWHGRWGREFGATRKSTDAAGDTYRRVHVGVDLFADDGDVVYATEDGVVVAALPYYKGLGAVYVLTDSGIVVNYGEVRMNSWKSYGVSVGDRVTKGQPIARVGVSSDGSHMLHVETYEPSTTVEDIRAGEMRWIEGDPPPDGVLDPTRYLVLARQAALDDIA